MPTLVALAAGMGSRFGGPKQLAPLGPSGETFLDYACHDAWRAGFARAVLVVRPEIHDAFAGLLDRWRDRLPIALVNQTLDTTRYPDRTKPWGTAHAVLAAADAGREGEPIDEPFAVLNADDFYGAAAYRTLFRFLAGAAVAPRATATPVWAVLGFPLGATLAEQGGVNRAVLQGSPDGWLEHVEEVLGIHAVDGGGEVQGDPTRRLPAETAVSMNMWGFTPALFRHLREAFEAFVSKSGDAAADPKAELLLPDVVQRLVLAGEARVRILAGEGPWTGLTHPEDRPRVVDFFRDLAERGDYPTPLWA